MKHNPIIKVLSTVIKASGFMLLVNFGFLVAHKIKSRHEARNGQFYEWKYGNIFYTVKGHGSPIVLIHGLKPTDSGNDMFLTANRLSADHTVYYLDLLGFGLSEKPWITYTNYLYVLLLRDFITDVIGEQSDILAAEGSCLFALQAKKVLGNIVGKVTLVEPCRKERVAFPKFIALRMKNIVDTPLYGTFHYNMYSICCGAPVDPAGRHVFVSRLTGHLSTDISNYAALITSDVAIVESKPETRISLDNLYSE